MVYRKAKGIPAKADPVAQAEFREKTLEPLLNEAAEGKREVYFADAAHFVCGSYLGYLWCFIVRVICSGAGRKRYSVLGALNAAKRTMICQTTVGTVTERTVATLLWTLRTAHPDGRPITVILDNAKYQHTALVRAVAAIRRIDLVYLPTYSPNLNLIERVWKFVKKKALANRGHRDFDAFCAAIDDAIAKMGTDYKDELKTLLTFNFETFEKSSV